MSVLWSYNLINVTLSVNVLWCYRCYFDDKRIIFLYVYLGRCLLKRTYRCIPFLIRLLTHHQKTFFEVSINICIDTFSQFLPQTWLQYLVGCWNVPLTNDHWNVFQIFLDFRYRLGYGKHFLQNSVTHIKPCHKCYFT